MDLSCNGSWSPFRSNLLGCGASEGSLDSCITNVFVLVWFHSSLPCKDLIDKQQTKRRCDSGILVWRGSWYGWDFIFLVVVNQNYAVIHNPCLGENELSIQLIEKTQTWRCITNFRSDTYHRVIMCFLPCDVEWRSSETPEAEHNAVLLTFGRRPHGLHRFGQKQGLCSGRCRIHGIY